MRLGEPVVERASQDASAAGKASLGLGALRIVLQHVCQADQAVLSARPDLSAPRPAAAAAPRAAGSRGRGKGPRPRRAAEAAGAGAEGPAAARRRPPDAAAGAAPADV